MEERILQILRRLRGNGLTLEQLVRQLGFASRQQRQVEEALTRLERSGRIARIKHGNLFVLPLEADLVPGRIRVNRQGVGFLQPDEPRLPTIRIPPHATGTAMHGDHVLVRREVEPRLEARRVAAKRFHQKPG